MMASKLLKPAGSNWLSSRVDKAMAALKDSYRHSLEGLLGRSSPPLWRRALSVVVLAVCAGGLFALLPQELVPAEDRGRVDVSINGPEGSGFDATVKVADRIEKIARPSIATTAWPSAAIISRAALRPEPVQHRQRRHRAEAPGASGTRSADEVAAELNKSLSKITSVRAVASVRERFQRGGGGGGGGGTNVDIIAAGNDYVELANWLKPILDRSPGQIRARRGRASTHEPISPRPAWCRSIATRRRPWASRPSRSAGRWRPCSVLAR